MLLLIQSGFIMAQTETVVTPNGKKVSVYTNPIVTANNGLTVTSGNVQLEGPLTKASTLTTTSVFTLAIKGLQTGLITDNLVLTDENGILKTINSTAFTNNWSLLGNTGTNPLNNFIGTIDNQPLQLKINNTNAGKISLTSTAVGYEALNPLSTGNNNVAFGSGALKKNTTGGGNIALGHQALLANTTGIQNLAIGRNALSQNIDGGSNIALGERSLFNNTSGSQNITLGNFSFSNNTTGRYNIGVGVGNLQSNIDGSDNIAIGHSALSRNSNGLMNIGIGNLAGSDLTSGTKNIIIGIDNQYGSGNGLQVSSADANNEMNIGNAIFGTGINNSTIGSAKIGVNTRIPSNAFHVKPIGTDDPIRIEGLKAGVITDQLVTTDGNGVLRNLQINNLWTIRGNSGTNAAYNFIGTTDDQDLVFKRNGAIFGRIAYWNIALGNGTLSSNTTGEQNSAFGRGALLSNTTGDNNTALGSTTLADNTTGKKNTAVGVAALAKNRTGNRNVALGEVALNFLLTGDNNISLGFDSGSYFGNSSENFFTNSAKSIFIGAETRALLNNSQNEIVIGYDAKGRGSNTVTIGNSDITSIGGYSSWTNYSDSRLKKNIVSSTYGLDFINKLRPVLYNMKTGTTEIQSGFIAQEVETAANSIGYKFSGIVKPQSDADFYSLRYSYFVVPLVKAVQEQQKTIEDLQKQLQEKDAKNAEFENRLLKLEQKLK